MRHRLIKVLAVCWVVMLPVLFWEPNLRSEKTRSEATIVEVNRTARGVAYKVDSKVAGSKPTDDLLHILNQVADEQGVNHSVIVFIDRRLPIDEIWNVNGVAAKAQLSNVRFFVAFRENQQMTEIKWTPFVPFSMNVPAK